jgi:Helix-turn-helix domain
MPIKLRRREKVFGPGRAVPLDRNAKVRIAAYARAWSARNRQPRQHRGPITRAFLEVLEALLWGFHNARSGRCFPSYEAIAAKAECSRDTVYEALKVLEWAGVLTWQHRIARIQVRERDLFGRWASRWRVIRTSNAYVFDDPLQRPAGRPASKSENPIGTLNQGILPSVQPSTTNPSSLLERALARFAAAVASKNHNEQGSHRQAGAPEL